MADCEASQCVEETIPNVPRSVGRVVSVTERVTSAGGGTPQSR
jgi:hypothetical protein